MKPFLISQERLLYELGHKGKALGKGSLNWFKSAEFGFIIINVYFNVNQVNYLCRIVEDEIFENTKQYLTGHTQVFGLQEEERVEEPFTIPEIVFEEET